MKVHLFDPEGMHRAKLEKVLSARGYRLVAHAETAAAWQAFCEDAPALVFIDGTGNHVGLELCRRLDTHRRPESTALLALVDGQRHGGIEEFFDAGADDYLVLPIDDERLEIRLRIAERRLRRRDALRESERRFRSLFEGLPVGAYRISPDGRFLDLNQTLIDLLGYEDREQLIGLESASFYVDPVDREAWRTLMKKDGRVRDFETQVYRRDRSTIWIRSYTQALYDDEGKVTGYDGSVEDITGRKRAEDALRASEDRFRSLVQNTSDLIAVLDAAGNILYQSPSGLRISGYREEERIGRSAFELVHPEDLKEVRRRFQQLLAEPGGAVQFEYRYRHRDESWRVFESIASNLLDNPAVRGIVVNTRDVTDRKRAEKRLRHDALYDGLTDLPNRVLFMDRLGHALDRYRRDGGQRCAVLFFDLDRFKMVNDSLGHAVGDLLLVEAGQRFAGCLRPNDTLARLGGDEFAILLEDIHNPRDPVRVAKRIQKAIGIPFQLNGREVYSSASIGIALNQEPTTTPEEILRDADTAMYRAKGRGRAGYAIFDAEMHAQVLDQLQLETALRRAVDQWQFEVFYQPIVALDTGEVAGCEALLRWHHPDRGLVLPDDFIPLTEETGLINSIGREVLTRACRQMKDWQSRLGPKPAWFITVNLSTRQFSQPELVEQIAEVLSDTGLSGRHLIIEITERVVMEDPDTVLPILRKLKRMKVQLSLDDFGTGHSSLRLLHDFPFDKVKIDHWFVRNLGIDRGSEELVEGVLSLCHWRRLVTVAEGVETDEQRRKLCELGCRYAQGYLFAKPAEPGETEKLLTREFLGPQR
ncbi:MAG: EAL domain-containing protein [bacterium]|nr:EAL domain-containing protein [bacterium]